MNFRKFPTGHHYVASNSSSTCISSSTLTENSFGLNFHAPPQSIYNLPNNCNDNFAYGNNIVSAAAFSLRHLQQQQQHNIHFNDKPFSNHFSSSTPTKACFSPVYNNQNEDTFKFEEFINKLEETTQYSTSNSNTDSSNASISKIYDLTTALNFDRLVDDNSCTYSSSPKSFFSTPESNESNLTCSSPVRAIKKQQNINNLNQAKRSLFVDEEKIQTFKSNCKKWPNSERKNRSISSCYSSPVSSLSSSPQTTPHSLNNRSHSKGHRQLPLRSLNVDLTPFLNKNSNQQFSSPNSNMAKDGKQVLKNETGCRFCITNGESSVVYMSHSLKDSLGKNVCPILRAYECPQCGESGDYAHTYKFCPETQRKQKQEKIQRFFNQI